MLLSCPQSLNGRLTLPEQHRDTMLVCDSIAMMCGSKMLATEYHKKLTRLDVMNIFEHEQIHPLSSGKMNLNLVHHLVSTSLNVSHDIIECHINREKKQEMFPNLYFLEKIFFI